MYPPHFKPGIASSIASGWTAVQQEPLDLSLPHRRSQQQPQPVPPPGGLLAQVAGLTGSGTPDAFAPPVQQLAGATAQAGRQQVGRPRAAVASPEAIVRRVPDAEKDVRLRAGIAQLHDRQKARTQAAALRRQAVEEQARVRPDDASTSAPTGMPAGTHLKRLAAKHDMGTPAYCRYRHMVTAANRTDAAGEPLYRKKDGSLDMARYWRDEWVATKNRNQRKVEQAAQAMRSARLTRFVEKHQPAPLPPADPST